MISLGTAVDQRNGGEISPVIINAGELKLNKEFIKPKEVCITIKGTTTDAFTGKIISTFEMPSQMVNVKEYEEAHGEFTKNDWLEWEQTGKITIFYSYYEGMI